MANRFLATKEIVRNDGELAPRTFESYYRTCDRLLGILGKNLSVDGMGTQDFETVRIALSKTLGSAARAAEIGRIKVLFNYAYREGLIEKPMRYGTAFDGPGRRVRLQEEHAKKEGRKLEAAEIRRMIDGANPQLRAMVLLGINAGCGNTDCATLTFNCLDLVAGWVSGPRHKTGVMRRAKLWPETVAAVQAAVAKRPEPATPDCRELVFLTKSGRPWVRMTGAKGRSVLDNVGCTFRELLDRLGINHGAAGFYSLRRMTETIGGGCKDQVAVDMVMGHVSPGMGSVYRLDIDDTRLVAVANHVRQWLFGTEETK